jgi:hypothetical protein
MCHVPLLIRRIEKGFGVLLELLKEEFYSIEV